MWRNTMPPVRIFIADARVLIPLMIVLLHIRLWTLYIALAGIVLFAVLEFVGLNFPAAMRVLRRWIVGRRRPAVPVWKKRRFA